MAEQILPGVSVEVRAEGLIIPGRVSVGNIGIIGTASRGSVDTVKNIGNLGDAFAFFGEYDEYIDNNSDELTLMRALEQAFAHGAQNVFAARIASAAKTASFKLMSGADTVATISADSAGTWGNDIEINVFNADENSFVSGEVHSGPSPISLNHTVVVESARNRISIFRNSTLLKSMMIIVYDSGGAPASGMVDISTANGDLTFAAGEEPAASDKVTASYVVSSDDSVKVTVKLGSNEESYTVVSGTDLVADISGQSSFLKASTSANAVDAAKLPDIFGSADDFKLFGSGANTRGDNGASGANYATGLELLLNENTHIIVAAGQSHTSVGAALTAHCNLASSDLNKRERVGVVGSDLGDTVDKVSGHSLNSNRIVFVAPGIQATDRTNGKTVTLSGGYAAAAVAGMMSSLSAHNSLTNKQLAVSGLEQNYTNAELTQLIQDRVLLLEKKFGFRIVKGITTATNTAWHQITTRRIVDFAKFGVRSAANPYIGLLNNERVRSAMRSTINSFLTEMLDDEKLVSYELEVSATRDEEIKGIARVTLVLRPTFSIDFIKVTMFLE